MFEAWGRFVCRWKRTTLLVSALWLAISVVVVSRGGRLTAGTISGIEADTALRLIERELHQPGGSSFTVIFHSPTLTNSDADFESAVRAAIEPLRTDPRVVSIRIPYDIPEPLASRLRSRDGHGVLAQIGLRDDFTTAAQYYPEIRSHIHSAQLQATFTGYLAFKSDLEKTLQEDLRRAEIVTMPLALIVLLLVFGSLVASFLPVGVGALAVVGGVAGVFLISRHTDVTQYAINIVTLIGLGVAIDYSLFIVTRFREQLASGASAEEAVVRSVATTGRAVAFSGLAVAIGLSGLLFYRGSYLPSMGLGGTIVVALAVLYALTFLPALLAILGARVNMGTLPVRIGDQRGFWSRVANAVMRRPVMVLIPTLALMVAVGSPFLRLKMAGADITLLPLSTEARQGYEMLRVQYPDQVRTRIVAIAKFASGPVLSPPRISALYDLSRRVSALPGVVRVESIADLDPSFTRSNYEALLSMPRILMPNLLAYAIHETVGPHIVILSVVTDHETASTEARDIVRAIRANRRVGDGEILVTGTTALDLDTTNYMMQRTPVAVAFVMILTYIILFLLLGSVILPLKAVVMNVLSTTGSFGALVWIFQEGHLHHLLRFQPGPVEPALPILLFCSVFGLSMDYEVLLLSRIQEEYERTHDNTHAVAEGLEKSGRLITSAAAIMVAVFVAFGLASVVVIKAIGLGMALAVTLDATIVRLLIVPSTMRLFGDLNWWAPRLLARWYQRIGLGHQGH